MTLTDVRSPSPAPEWAGTNKQRSGRIPKRSYSSRESTSLIIFQLKSLSFMLRARSLRRSPRSLPWIPVLPLHNPSIPQIHIQTDLYTRPPFFSSSSSSYNQLINLSQQYRRATTATSPPKAPRSTLRFKPRRTNCCARRVSKSRIFPYPQTTRSRSSGEHMATPDMKSSAIPI